MVTSTIKIIGMSCTDCASSVEIALKGIPGVQNVFVDFREERAIICFEIAVTTIDDLKRAIEDAGYETADVNEWK